MADLSLPTDCEKLKIIIGNAEREIQRLNERIRVLNDIIAKKIVRPPGNSNKPPEEELKELQQQLTRVINALSTYTNIYAQAVNQFNTISPQKCEKPNVSSCEKKNTSTIFGECRIPAQIRSVDRLQSEIEALEAELKQRITQIKVCLGVWDGPLPDGIIPVPKLDIDPAGPSDNDIPINIDAPWNNMTFNQAIKVAEIVTNHPCLDDNTKTKIKNLFNERDNRGRFENFTPGGVFTASGSLKKIFRDRNAELQKELTALEAEDNRIRKKIARLESLKLEYADENSETNKELKKLIKNIMEISLGECFTENKLNYSISTTITAARGPGAPVEIGEAYSITKVNEDACVTYDNNTKTMILDVEKAVALLGPGGCSLLSDEAKNSGGYDTGPYWIEPVTISSTITINNGNDFENCMTKKFFDWVRENTNQLYLVSYTTNTSERKPVFNISDMFSINYCISPPATE